MAKRTTAKHRVRWNPVDPKGLEDAARASAKWLRAHDLPFALIGGLAVQAHGYNRTTTDVDWVIPGDLDFFLREELRGDSAEAMMTTPLSFGGVRAWVFHPDVRVDFISRRDEHRDLYEAALRSAKNTKRVRLPGLLAPVIDLDFLVALKMASTRARDGVDATELLWRAPVNRARLRRILTRYAIFDWPMRLAAMEEEAAREKEWRKGKD